MLGSWSVTHKAGTMNWVASGEQVALVGGGAATGALVGINPHAVPRLALDRVLGGNWSFGAGVAFYSQSGSLEGSSGNLIAKGGPTEKLARGAISAGWLPQANRRVDGRLG